MPDRKKILHELEHQVADADWCDNDWKDNVPIWMLRGALTLLRKQEPVTVIDREWEEYWNIESTCPVCLTRWMAFDKHNNEIVNYCPGCGRKVILPEDNDETRP